MDFGSAPQRFSKRIQVAHLFGDPRPTLGMTGMSIDSTGKTLAIPTHHRLGPDDRLASRMRGVATIKPDEPNANAVDDAACAAARH